MKKLSLLPALLVAAATFISAPSFASGNYDTDHYGGRYPGYMATSSVPLNTGYSIYAYNAVPVAARVPSFTPWVDSVEEVRIPAPGWVIPTRYAQVNVQEMVAGPVRHYSLLVNGQNILQINNQATTLRLSKVFQLRGEDAIIVSAQNTLPGCTNRHHLVVVKGGTAQIHPITSCKANYETSIAQNGLFVSFGDEYDTLNARQTWRYQDNFLKSF